jgi:hypothetical protein
MFNFLSHKGNANQNKTEIPFHPSQNGVHQENGQQMLVRMVVVQGEDTLCAINGNVNYCSHYGNQYGGC